MRTFALNPPRLTAHNGVARTEAATTTAAARGKHLLPWRTHHGLGGQLDRAFVGGDLWISVS